ncbi:hypothetical protein DM02DRAFT_540563 [Periconia macrospinosa]|uniref:Rhodopsin domain-containing protein n=1 Tax=Periconia macrospinosa TaxID=97972 RepID=A0A2V1D8N9_9PLEO|nr:hypothetical protein DM02DRAFT_540563 [Periconia macrospinosa]
MDSQLLPRADNASYPGFVPPPPGVTPNLKWEPHQMNIVVQSLCISLTTAFVVTRLCIKWFLIKQMHLDDCLGVSQWNLPPQTVLDFLKRGYITQILYGPTSFVTKLAILLLLIRIFSIERRFVFFARVLIGVCAAYYIAITLVQIFLCRPIDKAYDPRIKGRCADTKKIFITNTVMAITSDLVVLVAPIPVIWKLNMGFWRRIGSTLALMAGGLACIATVARLVIIIKTMGEKDRAKSGPPIVMLSCTEVAIGVICSCLPVLPALFRRIFGRKEGTTYGSQRKQSTYNSWAKRNTIKLHSKATSTRTGPPGSHSRNSSQEHLR